MKSAARKPRQDLPPVSTGPSASSHAQNLAPRSAILVQGPPNARVTPQDLGANCPKNVAPRSPEPDTQVRGQKFTRIFEKFEPARQQTGGGWGSSQEIARALSDFFRSDSWGMRQCGQPCPGIFGVLGKFHIGNGQIRKRNFGILAYGHRQVDPSIGRGTCQMPAVLATGKYLRNQLHGNKPEVLATGFRCGNYPPCTMGNLGPHRSRAGRCGGGTCPDTSLARRVNAGLTPCPPLTSSATSPS
jgi:hypothetical protein